MMVLSMAQLAIQAKRQNRFIFSGPLVTFSLFQATKWLYLK